MPFHIPFFFSFAVAIDVLEGHLYAGFYEIRERKEFVHGNGALHGRGLSPGVCPAAAPSWTGGTSTNLALSEMETPRGGGAPVLWEGRLVLGLWLLAMSVPRG